MSDMSAEALTALALEALMQGRYRWARAWINVLIVMNDDLAEQPRTDQDAVPETYVLPICEHGYRTLRRPGDTVSTHVATGGVCLKGL